LSPVTAAREKSDEII